MYYMLEKQLEEVDKNSLPNEGIKIIKEARTIKDDEGMPIKLYTLQKNKLKELDAFKEGGE